MQERGPIQLSPPGLLGLLQLKVDGRGVPLLGDTCVPSLEMADWWLRATAQLWTAASAVTIAAGNIRAFTPFAGAGAILVPAGQWWFVHDYTVSFETGVGGAASGIRLVWASTTAGTIYYSALSYDTGLSTNELVASQVRLAGAGGFWLPPNSRLGIWCDGVGGVSGLIATVTQMRYSVCPS